jgi:uncharacterized membrane protein
MMERLVLATPEPAVGDPDLAIADGRLQDVHPVRPAERTRWSELTISYVLRSGVLVSLALIVAGVVVMFLQHPTYLHSAADYSRLTSPAARAPNTLGEVIRGVVDFRGEALIMFGLLVLLATPVLRVAISVLLFLAQRDATYALITSAVLLVLLTSLLLGRAGQ